MHKPLVSIVIPSYNHGDYIGRALDSIISQTYDNWEVIIIDNQSTDNTDDIIASFNDKRIACIKINNYGVIAKSRNLGISEAKGEWIAFLDSDDWWFKDKITKCLHLAGDDYDIIYHKLLIFTNNQKKKKNKTLRSRQVKKPIYLDLLLNGNPLATSSVMVKKELIRSIGGMLENPNLAGSEDFNTWLRLSEKTDRYLFVNEVLGSYQSNINSFSKIKDMSIPVYYATKDFLQYLSYMQNIIFQFRLLFIKLRYYCGVLRKALRN